MHQNRKVLIITYYWPPSGGPGVQRVLKFAKYLPDFGWHPVILTVLDGEYPAIDHSLVTEIPSDLEVYKVKSIEFFDLFRKLTGKGKGEKIETFELVKDHKNLGLANRIAQYIRMNIFIPDARIGWYLKGRKKSFEILQKVKPQLIFSSSPPHSLQLLASHLSRRGNIPWVADFRDPWTKSFYDKGLKRNILTNWLNKSLENKIVTTADCVTSVSAGVIQLLGKPIDDKVAIIPNGYDEEDFTNNHFQANTKFVISYTGHVASVQNPILFFEALAQLPVKIRRLTQVDFYGSVDAVVKENVSRLDLQSIVTFHGYIPHHEATKIMMKADLLLLLIPHTHAKGILTGKLFEYLASGNPILGIGDATGIAAEVIKKCEGGTMTSYTDSPYDLILSYFESWKSKIKNRSNMQEIKKYSRRNLTAALAKVFDDLCR